jgi:hypothetical protein
MGKSYQVNQEEIIAALRAVIPATEAGPAR